MRIAVAVSLAGLALVGCVKAGSQGATGNAASTQTGSATVVAGVNEAVAANSPSQTAAGGPGVAGPPLPGPPWADAPANASAVTIQFQRGTHCWMYYGVASTFNGRFAAGQRLDITSTGEQQNGDGSRAWYETVPRSVDIAGADGKLLIADQSGYFDIPGSGAYQVSFDPLSMVGQPGVMIVCTL
jgi:hypothetical protein